MFLLAVSAAIFLWRIFLVLGVHTPTWQNYYRTDTRIDSILFGAILATSRRKIDLSALWSTVRGDAKPAGDDRRVLPSVAMLE